MQESRRNLILGSVAVVLLIAAAYFFFARWDASAQLPTEMTVHGVCLACQQEVNLTHSMGQRAPFACPHCAEQAVYVWSYCYDCRTRFVPQLARYPDEEFPQPPAIPACAACGSGHTGAFDPRNPKQDAVGNAPLPDWPVP